MSESAPDLDPAAAAGQLTAPHLSKKYAAAGWEHPTVTIEGDSVSVSVTISARMGAVVSDSIAEEMQHRVLHASGPVGKRARPLPVVVDGIDGGSLQVADVESDDRLTVRLRRPGVELATRPAAAVLNIHADLLAHFAAEALPSRAMPR
jgi:hypothetical protein